MKTKPEKESLKGILVVDDEEIIRKSCTISLSKAGYQIYAVENGIKALNLLPMIDCDIVLLDLKMPIMGGLELLGMLRRDYPHLQVIIMTAYATVENAINAMKEGAYDFILKPFKPDQLRLIIDRCAKSIDLKDEIKQLKLTNQKLKEIQEMKDKFIAITSHELRTPVSHVKGYLSILNDKDYSDISEAERQEFMKIIFSAVTDLEHIVHNMFDIVQFENKRQILNVEEFSFDQLVLQVVTEFQLILKKRMLTLTVIDLNIETDIIGDRLRLKQVISELIQNAIKYTPDGGNIEIRTGIADEYYFMKVIDTGVGISDSEKGKIFEKFYEVQNTDYHSSSKANFMGGGIGLGLTIVKSIIEAHNGRVIVDSELNKGSQFTILLPLNFDYETE